MVEGRVLRRRDAAPGKSSTPAATSSASALCLALLARNIDHECGWLLTPHQIEVVDAAAQFEEAAIEGLHVDVTTQRCRQIGVVCFGVKPHDDAGLLHLARSQRADLIGDDSRDYT